MPDKRMIYTIHLIQHHNLLIIAPSDEDFYACPYFRGANMGFVFITTKLSLTFLPAGRQTGC